MDNYMTDYIKVGQKKAQSSATIETKPVEPKPSAKKEVRYNRQRGQSKASLNQVSDRTNRSINPLERESLNSSKLVKTQRRSKSNILEPPPSAGNTKKEKVINFK